MRKNARTFLHVLTRIHTVFTHDRWTRTSHGMQRLHGLYALRHQSRCVAGSVNCAAWCPLGAPGPRRASPFPLGMASLGRESRAGELDARGAVVLRATQHGLAAAHLHSPGHGDGDGALAATGHLLRSRVGRQLQGR